MEQEHESIASGSRNRLYQACDEPTRTALLKRGRMRPFSEGETLYSEGEPAGAVLLPMRGTLQFSKTAPSGRRQVFCYASADGCPAVCFLMMTERSLVDVVAVDAGEVLTLSPSDLSDLTSRDPHLVQATWSATIHCLSHFLGMVENLSFLKVSERVVLALLERNGSNGGVVRRTQAELAAEVGTTREVVARCLAELQGSGAIKLGRGRITVLSRDRLSAIS